MLKTINGKTKPVRLNFTKEAIHRLVPPAEGRTYIYDAKIAGLAICTTAAGTKTFYHYRKLNGKPERIRLGPWPDLTIDQARRQATSHNGAIAEGKNPAIKMRIGRNAPTLGEVFVTFIELPTRTKAKRPKSLITIKGYRQLFDSCLSDWRDFKLSTITKTAIEKLHNQLGLERGHYMANRALELLRALFNCAIDLDLYSTNPAARLRGFEEKSRDRFLHADELPKFWKALEAEPSEKIRDFILLALFTGQRRSNCLAMRWVDIDFDRAEWNLPQTKTGSHKVPLTAEAIKVLKRRRESKGDGEFVFPGRHGHGFLTDPMRQWRGILKRAGIDNLRIHDLRRSLGSWEAATGASLNIIGKTLGHSRPETTAIYSRLETAPVRAAMEAATSAILLAAQPKRRRRAKKGGGNGRA